MSAWAVLETLWISRARLTVAIVAPALTLVLPTVQLRAADVGAPLPLAPTSCCPLLFSTETVQLHLNRTRLAGSFMALVLALVNQAIEKLVALVLARKLRALGELARHALLLFAAVAGHWYVDAARRAAAWMAEDVAPAMRTGLMLLLVAVFSA